jgi:hypothetical protein
MSAPSPSPSLPLSPSPRLPRSRRRPPPSDRDQALYREYSTSGKTQAQLAAEHGLSQARLSQITRRVRAWLANTAPDTLTRRASEGDYHSASEGANAYLPDDQRQALIQRLEYERLEQLFRQAMRTFSKTTVTTHREGSFGPTPFVEKTVRELAPAAKWLKIALRAAKDLSRLELTTNISTCADPQAPPQDKAPQ